MRLPPRYVGYTSQIARSRARGQACNGRLLIARQGSHGLTVAINQLDALRERLVAQHVRRRLRPSPIATIESTRDRPALGTLLRRLGHSDGDRAGFIVGLPLASKNPWQRRERWRTANVSQTCRRRSQQGIRIKPSAIPALHRGSTTSCDYARGDTTLADLQPREAFGIRVSDASNPRELPAPELRNVIARFAPCLPIRLVALQRNVFAESIRIRVGATARWESCRKHADASQSTPWRVGAAAAGPIEAIALYNQLLTEYPSYQDSASPSISCLEKNRNNLASYAELGLTGKRPLDNGAPDPPTPLPPTSTSQFSGRILFTRSRLP